MIAKFSNAFISALLASTDFLSDRQLGQAS